MMSKMNKGTAILKELIIVGLITSGIEATCDTTNDDCKVSYGNWSDCDPCTKQISRHASIENQPHFDGIPCPESFVEHKPCDTNKTCHNTSLCPAYEFDCGYLGRCIDNELVCNGDDDCGNNADEFNCNNSRLYERAIVECHNLSYVPYLDQIGTGVNLISGKLAGRVVDNQRFQGLCRKAFDGDKDKIYRLPYNVDNFNFHVKTSDDVQVKSFSSMSEYVEEKISGDDTSIGGSVSAGLPMEGKLGASGSYSNTDSFKDIFTNMKNQDSKLFRISTEIQLAEFLMKGHDLMLDGFFEHRIWKLPINMNTKSYFDFFDQYGTAYLHSGVLGGKFEHFYIFSSDQMKRERHTNQTLANCLKGGFQISLGFINIGFEAGHCKTNDLRHSSSAEVASSATHKVVNIDGGTSQMAAKLAGAALASNGTFRKTKFAEWVTGVQQNPTLLRKKVRPICELILSSKDPQKHTKHALCLNASKAYMQPYSTDQCKSCKKGHPININGKCQCACDENYTGPRCATPFKSAESDKTSKEQRHFKSGSYHPDSQSDLKFSTENGIANNPPYMQWLNIGLHDNILKMKDKHLFLLARTERVHTFPYGWAEHQIKEYDYELQHIRSTKIDFNTIDHCHGAHKGFCEIVDFDIDTHGNFIISVKVGNEINSSVCKIDKTTGKAILQISQPCALDFDDEDFRLAAYVTTTCTDHIVISCPNLTPATVKIYTSDGHPEQLNQFSGYDTFITGMKHFNKAIWFHTHDNRVAAFDLGTLEEVFSFDGVSIDLVGPPEPHCQLAVDFLGNVVIGQAHRYEEGKLNYKLTIVEGSNAKVLAHIKMDNWTECHDVATYRGKLYTTCKTITDHLIKSAILIFDYLK